MSFPRPANGSKSPNLRTPFQLNPLTFLALKWHTQLEQLDDDITELVEKYLIIFGVALNMLFEFFVFDQRHVGGQHHQGAAFAVLVLLGAVPLYSMIFG